MFCKNCGKEIDDAAVVCPNCGAATDKFKEPAISAQTAESSKLNVFAIIGFIMSLVAFAFAFIIAIVYWIALIAAITLSILGLVWSVKKGANLKGLAIAGVVISAVDLALWLILFLVAVSLVGALI